MQKSLCDSVSLELVVLWAGGRKRGKRGYSYIIEALNHGMSWVGKDLKDHPVPTPLPWAGLPPTS